MYLLRNKSLCFGLLIAISSFQIGAQTNDQAEDFAKAARFDDVSEVKTLISKGVSPNTVDAKGNPMLVLAIKDRSTKVTELLLQNRNIDVDLSNKYGETPLMMASIEGDLPIVKTLVLQNKARIDHIGWTPLHYACAKGNLDVAKFLVANGAVVDSNALNGTTPLMMAVQSGNEDLIRFLLENGADIRLRNTQGFSAIDIAEIYDKPWIADGLKSRWQKLYKQPYPGPQKQLSTKSS
ncbi:ankyrin repeat domain-containing protein [Polynucleobacter sp. MWH-UH2A]|uniref:ankyrin repeat domain-containing protein n=1 Tax=Polynucleobacter sp. MWH-UH2A TaxID=1855617 RepID=UPI001BFCDD43|nr:ankyrin repeat domain-containing protein [Polynucleobacter sp. MWH-UH2A]QWD65021.1 ankyrin repeat domain-containing protein [Polynucleobacter sp. MWH-UH2A]